jgi:hypothetical protein
MVGHVKLNCRPGLGALRARVRLGEAGVIKKAGYLLGAVACAIVGGTFWLMYSPTTASIADEDPDVTAQYHGVGPLDGMTFVAMLGPDGKPKDVPDTFVFENGMFVSKECEVRCKYPPRPYYVREVDGKTEFISETECPYKDAQIVWRGTIEGDKVVGKSTWTMRRWYWTIESDFEFEGTLAPQPS